jgi:hypothetical protein
MATYKFNAEHIVGVMQHIQAYDIIITSMEPQGSEYIITLERSVPEDQVEHLLEEYNFVEVST